MKTKRSPQEWQNLINEYEKSGLSVSAFCRLKDIKANSMRHWLKKKKKQPITTVQNLVKVAGISHKPKEPEVKLRYKEAELIISAGLEKSELTDLFITVKEVFSDVS